MLRSGRAGRVVIDGRPLMGRTGISRYARTLIAGMPRLDASRRYSVFAWRSDMFQLRNGSRGTDANFVSSAIPGRLLAKLSYRYSSAPRWGVGKADLFHSTSFDPPHFMGMRTVVTAHDVAFLHVPDAYPPGVAEGYDRGLRKTLRYVDAVICVSQHGMHSIVEHFGVTPDRVRVLYPAVVDQAGRSLYLPHPPGVGANPRPAYQGKPFLLVVGELNPRKNLLRLVEAFAQAAAQEAEHHLVLVGPPATSDDGHYARLVQRHAEDLGVAHRVHLLGSVSDADLSEFYDTCTALVCCSLYEGFGYPVAEAMSRGVPVIASNVSSLPEVGGSAAILVEPSSTDAIAHALLRVTSDADLRRAMAVAGPHQAVRFTDNALFAGVLALYEDLGV